MFVCLFKMTESGDEGSFVTGMGDDVDSEYMTDEDDRKFVCFIV